MLNVAVGVLVNKITDSLTWSFAIGLVLLVICLTLIELWRADIGGAGRRRVMDVPPLEPHWVRRPQVLGEVVAGLTRAKGRAVGVTTGLHGAGGFGKTTLAVTACHHRAVRRHFAGGMTRVTVGQDRAGPELVALVNDVIKRFDGTAPAYSGVEQAGQELGRLLAKQGRFLLVVDDVWTAEQLEPFMMGAPACVRLITTRVPGLLPSGEGAVKVEVDQLRVDEARTFVQRRVPGLSGEQAAELIRLTGRWALLLEIATAAIKEIADEAGPGTTGVRAAADGFIAQLAADRLAADDPEALNVRSENARRRAVRASVGYSLRLLTTEERDLFAELGIFGEDAHVPVSKVSALWAATGRLGEAAAGRLVRRLHDLSLVVRAGGAVRVHDVVREYMRQELAQGGLLNEVHRTFVAAVRVPCWWELLAGDGYLWRHLSYHLAEAGLREELDAVVTDPRWIVAKLLRSDSGLPSVEADLGRSTGERAAALRRALGQSATLLADAATGDTREQVTIATLLYRMPEAAGVGPGLVRMLEERGLPYLAPFLPAPDLPEPMLVRTLGGDVGQVKDVAAGNGWLAYCGDRGARLWRVQGKAPELRCSPVASVSGDFTTVTVAPDGSWFATGAYWGGKVRLWSADGGLRAIHRLHPAIRLFTGITAMNTSPDGRWLAAGNSTGKVRLWDMGEEHARITVRAARYLLLSGINALRDADGIIFYRDGSGFATVSDQGGVRRWNAKGRRTAQAPRSPDLSGGVKITRCESELNERMHLDPVPVLIADGAGVGLAEQRVLPHSYQTAVAPDGSWLATANSSVVEIRDTHDDTRVTILRGHSGTVTSLAVSPGGEWMATGSEDGTARLWNVAASARSDPAGGQDLGGHSLLVTRDGERIWVFHRHRGLSIHRSDDLKTVHGNGLPGIEASAQGPGEAPWVAVTVASGTLILDRDGGLITALRQRTTNVARDPEGRWVAVFIRSHDSVHFFDADGVLLGIAPVSHLGRKRAAVPLCVSPDGLLAAVLIDGVRRFGVRSSVEREQPGAMTRSTAGSRS